MHATRILTFCILQCCSTLVFGQIEKLDRLYEKFHFKDTLILKLDSPTFNFKTYEFQNCPKLNTEYNSIFTEFSGYQVFEWNPYRLHSIKRLDNDLIAMTIIGDGKYLPTLNLLCFKSGKLVSELLLQHAFVDAGQVDIYKAQPIDDYNFIRSYYTEWEIHKEGKGYTITDSTAVKFNISKAGTIDTLDVKNYQKEIEWKN